MKCRSWTVAAAESRRTADRRLAGLSNVIGTAVGLKKTDGVLTGDRAYLVFVTRKVPKSRLRVASRVPSFVTRRGQQLRTDVVEMPELRLEVRSTRDGRQQATVTCSAANASGTFLLTCAHAILGPDGTALTPDAITVAATATSSFVPVGTSGRVILHSGLGTAADFGLIDAGLVTTIHSGSVTQHVKGAGPLPLRTTGLAERLPVFGEGGRTGRHSGFIRGLGVRGFSSRVPFADMMIESATGVGMTLPGDSGLLWRDAEGRAVAMHVMGEDRGPNIASRISVATLMSRLPGALGVALRE